MQTLDQINQEIENIKNRNARVEADKAWETSMARKLLISLLTYIVIVIFLFAVNIQKPFINAIVPTLGFFLSTLTIPVIRGRRRIPYLS